MERYQLSFELDTENSGIDLEGFLDCWLSDIVDDIVHDAEWIAGKVKRGCSWRGSVDFGRVAIPLEIQKTAGGAALRFRVPEKEACPALLLGLLQAGTDFSYSDDVYHDGDIDDEFPPDPQWVFSNVRKTLLDTGRWDDEATGRKTFSASITELEGK